MQNIANFISLMRTGICNFFLKTNGSDCFLWDLLTTVLKLKICQLILVL